MNAPLPEAVGDGGPLVIVAEDVEGEALASLWSSTVTDAVASRSRLSRPWLRRSPQGHAAGDRVLTGGTAISEDLGIKLENVTIDDAGPREAVLVDKENTTIVDGDGKKADIEARRADQAQIEETTSDCAP